MGQGVRVWAFPGWAREEQSQVRPPREAVSPARDAEMMGQDIPPASPLPPGSQWPV